MSARCKVAIVGSGNIGTDLMIKILRGSRTLEVVAMAGIDPESDGLARARRLGVATTHEGLEGLRKSPLWGDIAIVFDATDAKAHVRHQQMLSESGKVAIDLTPAAIGPYVIPVVNGREHLDAQNLNMVSCGGQAAIPIVAAVSAVARVHWAEVVASIASRSAGPGTRANIDEFTETTSKGIVSVGKAERGKAIIVLNPADPPMIMRDTVHTLSTGAAEAEVSESIHQMVAKVTQYVPGYRLKQDVQFERGCFDLPGGVRMEGLKSSVFIEVEGAGHYLPKYAGNLDIMTSAALQAAEDIARHRFIDLEAA
jgi:acetaldehyde dehydrogenase